MNEQQRRYEEAIQAQRSRTVGVPVEQFGRTEYEVHRQQYNIATQSWKQWEHVETHAVERDARNQVRCFRANAEANGMKVQYRLVRVECTCTVLP